MAGKQGENMDLGYFETSLPVKDVVASMAFYEAVGFERTEYAADAGTATMVLGDCRFMLTDPDGHPLYFIHMPGVARTQPDSTRASAA
jgi:predicted lactoylglutathione lyase